jgi:hypothetical protein
MTQAARRQLPYGPLLSTRTVWLIAVSWAPLVGLVVACGRLETRWLLNGALVLTFLLVRLIIVYVAARKASASPTRAGAVAWMAMGATIFLFLSAPLLPRTVYQHSPQENAWSPWEDIRIYALMGAAWYSLLGALLYRPAARSSYERADYAVALAGLWVALPTLSTNLSTEYLLTYLPYDTLGALDVYLQHHVIVALLWRFLFTRIAR